MNINLEKNNIGLIIEALESYQLGGGKITINGNVYVWTKEEIGDLVNYLNKTLEKSNDYKFGNQN